jgi:hypothetical protein
MIEQNFASKNAAKSLRYSKNGERPYQQPKVGQQPKSRYGEPVTLVGSIVGGALGSSGAGADSSGGGAD